jgi:[acyl-carrier-protein] S-malonyltransferase
MFVFVGTGAQHTLCANRLKEALAGVTIKQTRIPVISNVHAGPHVNPEQTRNLLAAQVTAPVRWEQTMAQMLGIFAKA